MAHSTAHVVRRLLVASLAGGGLAAGITAIGMSPAADRDMAANDLPELGAPTLDVRPPGGAGTGMTAGMSARAEGIAMAGADRLAARPSISTGSGRRLAAEATVRSPGDLVTAWGVELSAAVIGGHSSAHATVQHAAYGGHDLGRLAVGCRDGVPTAERTGTVRLTATIIVDYGQTRGHRVTGATVLVLGPGDRASRVITIATVSCTSPDTPRTPSPPPSSQPNEPTMTPPSTSTSTLVAGPAGVLGDTPPHMRMLERPGRSERRWTARASASSTRVGHLSVTG